MIGKICLALLVMVVCVHSLSKLPEHFPPISGVCHSGLPLDSTFNSCSLDGVNWRVGSWSGDKHIALTDVKFPPRFTPVLGSFGEEDNISPTGCAVRLPSQGIVFQYLRDYISHSHYRLRGCAKVHGTSPCKVQIKNLRNNVVDELVFNPPVNSTCNLNPPMVEDCVSECTTGWSWMTVRYVGFTNYTILVRQHALDGSIDTTMPLTFENLVYGDEFNITAADFMQTDPSVGSMDILPEQLEFWTGPEGDQIDVFVTACNSTTALPGQRFGDDRQFLVSRVETLEGSLCPVSRAAKLQTCACEEDEVKMQCLESLKGFVALPEDDYYIGMVSEECSCSFDNICIERVGNEEGYFGLDWIHIKNNSTSTI